MKHHPSYRTLHIPRCPRMRDLVWLAVDYFWHNPIELATGILIMVMLFATMIFS